jgi:hypothetical protein
MGVQKHDQNKILQNNRVEKFLQRNRQKSQTDVFFDLFYHVFGRFSVREVKNTTHKTLKKSDPVHFFASF